MSIMGTRVIRTEDPRLLTRAASTSMIYGRRN